MPNHVAHGAEAEASQALLKLGTDKRDVRERELEHEIGLCSGGYYVHAVRRAAGARLGHARGELRYKFRRPSPDRQRERRLGDHSIAHPAGRRSQRLSAVQLLGAREIERSEEHTSELQSLAYLVCRLLLEKKKKQNTT